MHSLYKSKNLAVDRAYIIYLPDNPVSSHLAARCQASCEAVEQPFMLWPGFDGTGPDINVPPQLRSQDWIKWIKVMDHFQSRSEICCSLSHISLWARCMELDQPLIVLEHDAVMTKPLSVHRFYNTVQYLGYKDQKFDFSQGDHTPLSSINHNWTFINRAHAYSIDPAAARRLFGMVMERGIFESLDVMIMADAVGIVQFDIYAYDDPMGVTTITDRKQTGQHGPGTIRV